MSDIYVKDGAQLRIDQVNGVLKMIEKGMKATRRWTARNEDDVRAYVYNNMYHLLITDRQQVFAKYLEEPTPESVAKMARGCEVSFSQDGKTYTGFGVNVYRNGLLEVRCSSPKSIRSPNGYYMMYVKPEELIILKGER